MDAKTIETLAVSAVRNSIVTSGYLDQFITDNDKEPSWDGAIFVYEGQNRRRDKINGRLPVQVKGTYNDDFSSDEISYQISTADLRNYLHDGGAMFFVVYIGNNGASTKIYYVGLPPVKLRILLENTEKQKTKSVHLKTFPNDGDEKATIVGNCKVHCRMQSSFADSRLYSIEELQEIGVLEYISLKTTTYGSGNHDPYKALLSAETYIYAQIKGAAIPQPLLCIPDAIHISMKIEAKISVKGEIFYDSYTICRGNNYVLITIGESYRIEYSQESTTSKIKYDNSDKLRVLVTDLDFCLSAHDAGQYEINEYSMPIGFDPEGIRSFDIEHQKQNLACYKRIVQMFDMLGATNDICLSQLSSLDRSNIENLVAAFIEKKPACNLPADLSPVCSINISIFMFFLSFIPHESENTTYFISDFFKTSLNVRSFDKDGNEYEISQYALLKPIDYLTVTNIWLDAILPSYQKLPDSNSKFEFANITMLHLITAYDMSGGEKPELLNVAADFAKWMMDTENEDYFSNHVTQLNHLQIIRRTRNFNGAELGVLRDIITDKDASDDVLVGAHLLLGHQMMADVHFHKLSPEMQESFTAYPIYHFWQST